MSRDKDGNIVARDKIVTAGEPAGVRLSEEMLSQLTERPNMILS